MPKDFNKILTILSNRPDKSFEKYEYFQVMNRIFKLLEIYRFSLVLFDTILNSRYKNLKMYYNFTHKCLTDSIEKNSKNVY